MADEELKEIVEEPTTKEKKELTSKQKTAIFAARLVAFILFSIGGPITYIMCRFKPFTQSQSTQIGFAGVAVIVILLVGVAVLIGFYLEGMKSKFSILKQIMEGILKIILPLVGLLALCWGLSKYLEQLMEILIVLIPFEMVAIIVNPLPKWAFENNIEGFGNILGGFLDKFKKEK